MYVVAARRLGDTAEEMNALTMHVQLLSRRGDLLEVEQYLPRLRELARSNPPTGELFFHLRHAQGLYHLAGNRLSAAQQEWQLILDRADAMQLPDHMVIGTQYWLATCLYQQGLLAEARRRYQRALEQARQQGYERLAARSLLHLAVLDLDQGALSVARERLTESRDRTVSSDWEQLARIQQAWARLYIQERDQLAARAALLEAIDLFERMGLTVETQAARKEYTALIS
jgi:tetratricopeptide (TPR) repeat protein